MVPWKRPILKHKTTGLKNTTVLLMNQTCWCPSVSPCPWSDGEQAFFRFFCKVVPHDHTTTTVSAVLVFVFVFVWLQMWCRCLLFVERFWRSSRCIWVLVSFLLIEFSSLFCVSHSWRFSTVPAFSFVWMMNLTEVVWRLKVVEIFWRILNEIYFSIYNLVLKKHYILIHCLLQNHLK